MQVRHVEGLANRNGPESCVGVGDCAVEALTGERAGRVLSREIHEPSGCRRCGKKRKATSSVPPARGAMEPRAVGDPVHAQKHRVREPGGLAVLGGQERRRAHREVDGRTPMMHDREKSDRLIVPWTPPNNAGQPAAEAVEGSGRTKGNSCDDHDARTQCRTHASTGLERVRQAASRDRQQRFTATVNGVLDADICGFSTRMAPPLPRAPCGGSAGGTFPAPRICHPYPDQRLAFITQGRSRMR